MAGVIFSTTFLVLSLSRISFCFKTSPKCNSFRTEALLAVGNRFTPNCFWIIFESDQFFDSSFSTTEQNEPILLLDKKNLSELEDWKTFINRGTFIEKTCAKIALFEFPQSEILSKLEVLTYNRIRLYIIFVASSIQEAEGLLLDSRLENEMNVAAILENSDAWWMIYARDLYTPRKNIEVIYINKWTKNYGFDTENDIFFDQTANFYGKLLRGSTLDFMPFTAYDITAKDKPVVPGISLDFFMLDTIAYALNFTYNMFMPLDGIWGTIGADVSWTQDILLKLCTHFINF